MRQRGKIAIGAAIVLLLLAVVLVWSGFYLSNLIRDDGLVPDHEAPELDLVVTAMDDGQITLQTTSETDENGDWQYDGLYGLVSESGYDQVGRIIEITDQNVVREYFTLMDDPATGERVRVDGNAFPQDPLVAHGIPFKEVSFSSPLGDFPAWHIDGTSDTWAIFVHGRNSQRKEALRLLPKVVELGFPSLVITYRNDEGLPQAPDGLHRYGLTEWQEVEGAARYALEHGAENLVLVGYSMGGGIVTNFLYQSPLAEEVSAVILDAPMLDLSATVDFQGSDQGYPQLVLSYAKAFSALRFDVDWEGANYLSRVDQLSTPILLFHGDDDKTVPVTTSDDLAESRPDLVEYVRLPGVGHVRAWNYDPEAYEAKVEAFLRSNVND